MARAFSKIRYDNAHFYSCNQLVGKYRIFDEHNIFVLFRLVSQLDQMIERDGGRSLECIVPGTQTVQFIGDVEGGKDGDFIAVRGPGPSLHILHAGINKCSKLSDIVPVAARLDAVGLAEYLYLDAFHGLRRSLSDYVIE